MKILSENMGNEAEKAENWEEKNPVCLTPCLPKEPIESELSEIDHNLASSFCDTPPPFFTGDSLGVVLLPCSQGERHVI